MTEEDLRRRCLALPGVTERLSWGRPAWFVRSLMARMWDDETVTLKTEERDALAGSSPDVYFWTPHHDRSPHLVLVRLRLVPADELDELVEEAFRIAGGGQHGAPRRRSRPR